MAAFWLNQYHPRNKTRPWFAMASRGNKNSPRIVLQSTATKIVIKLVNCNQYRVGTRLHRVHTDCLGRKFSPQRSQYTVALRTGIQTSDRRQLTAFAVPKTTGPMGSFGLGRFSCTKVYLPARGGFVRSSGLRTIDLRVSCSPEPGGRRSRFAAFVLQLVQLLLQTRFALLQILQLAIPVIDVRDVVFHPGGHIKTAASVLLDVVLYSRHCLVDGGDLAQNLLRAPTPVFFVVLSRISILIRWPCAPRIFLRRLPHHGYTRALHPGQIILGVHLALRHSWLFCLGFARRLCE